MANKPIDLPPVMAKIRAAFIARDEDRDVSPDQDYLSTKWRLGGRLEELNARMNQLIATPFALPISQQISLEAQWLINYTDDWARATETLDRLETSLTPANQSLLQQDDGSYGSGCTEFYRKLEPTVDFLQSDAVLKPNPGQALTLNPLLFMKWLMNPAEVEARLNDLRVSRIHKTGRNNRDEFGSMITSLAQLFFKSKLRKAFALHPETEFNVSDDSFKGLRDYLWSIQSSETGYWGPTYDFDGEVIEVQDLSYTFHVVKYYNNSNDDTRKDLPKTDKIVATTEEVETFSYPNGLKPPPPDFSDHNNYDLVTMFQMMWPMMSGDAKRKAKQEITTLLEWCLTTSLMGDIFAASKDMSTVNSYYYGVQFLLVAGFWPQQLPFWTTAPVPVPSSAPKPAELATRLLKRFQRDFDDKSDVAKTVIATLTAALPAAPTG
jgi:hypothetical protein